MSFEQPSPTALQSSQELYEFSAPCPLHFEEALAAELRDLGCRRVRPLTGSVSFAGDNGQAMRVCLWSRIASRLTLVLKRVNANTADELYGEASRIAWEQHLRLDSTFAVRVRGANNALRDQRFTAQRVKDAIVDRFRQVTGTRPSVDSERPDLYISCVIHRQKATLGIDLAGETLINRSYRVARRSRSAANPGTYLREDLAYLMLDCADWPRRSRREPDSVFLDPLGTTPTLAIEAACVACDRAPGLLRPQWGFEAWAGYDPAIWGQLIDEADGRFEAGLATGRRVIVLAGDPGVRAEIASMAARARVQSAIHILDASPADLDLGPASLSGSAMGLCLPDRMGASVPTSDLPALLAAVGALCRTPALREAPIVSLSPDDDLAFALMAPAEKTLRVMNGSSSTAIHLYPSQGRVARMAAGGAPAADSTEAAAGPGGQAQQAQTGQQAQTAPSVEEASLTTTLDLGQGKSVEVLLPTSDQFAARLAKVAKQRAKWARKNGVSCYRIYDTDLPDYAFTVDLYQGCASTPGRWVVLSEHCPPKEIDPVMAARRRADALVITPQVLDIDPHDLFFKTRKHSRGGSQYAQDHRGRVQRTALVEEGGLVFEVNFTDYLDSGLFLDNRPVRERIRQSVGTGRFLNLFAYTGTASVYAADGGAFSTTTVDMSATYLSWAQRNMQQNGFSGPAHEFVQADVTQWIREQRRSPKRWGLIYIDPPTFSNSARMRVKGFDVQRDHAELLIGASRLLSRDGQIIFTCNLRSFKPDTAALAKAGVIIEDVTASSIPDDYARNARVHHCYLVRRAPEAAQA